MVVLGVDLSLAATGLALVEFSGEERPRLVDQRVVLVREPTKLPLRAVRSLLVEQIRRVALEPTPRWKDIPRRGLIAGIERPVMRKNTEYLFLASRLLGQLEVWFEEFGVPVTIVNPSQTKAALGLTSNAVKDEVVSRVTGLLEGGCRGLDFPTKKEREAVADAVGVAKATYLLEGE